MSPREKAAWALFFGALAALNAACGNPWAAAIYGATCGADLAMGGARPIACLAKRPFIMLASLAGRLCGHAHALGAWLRG